MTKPKKRLGELLVEAGLIDEYQLRSALSHQQQWGGRIGKNLVELGLIEEKRLLAFLARHFRLPAIDFKRIRISETTLKLVSPDMCKKHNVIPLFAGEEDNKKFVAIAMANPTDLLAIDELEFACGKKIRPVVGSDISITAAITYYYDSDGQPPYTIDAKNSDDMTYADVIAITKQFLKEAKEAEAPEPLAPPEPPEPVASRENVVEQEGDGGTDDDGGDDDVIVFGSGGERKLTLDDDDEVPEPEPDLSTTIDPSVGEALGAVGDASSGPDTDQVLRGLISVLVEKGIITKEELRRKIK